jgi:hypothetical protein
VTRGSIPLLGSNFHQNKGKHMNYNQEADDRQAMSTARNKVLYGGEKNTIVEWTLSEEWLTIPNDRPQEPVSGEFEAHF